MGMTFVEGVVSGESGQQQTVKLLVDSGAGYSLLPCDVWQALGLKAKRTMNFTLADGSTIQRNISECHISLAGHEGHTPVILGEPGDEPLLGALTLEIFGLVLDPFQRTLRDMQMRLG